MQIKDVIEKLSSYNLFNYLFPGFLFTVILKYTTCYIHNIELTVTSVVVIYFIGLVLSRIGSLIIEGLMLKLSLIEEINTQIYIERAKDNSKLETIFEAMNMYRTLASMSIVLSVFTYINLFFEHSRVFASYGISCVEFLSFIMFLFAYRKQRVKVLDCLKSKIYGPKDLPTGIE